MVTEVEGWAQRDNVRLVATTVLLYLFGALVLDRVAALVAIRIEAGLAIVLALAFLFGKIVAIGAGLGVVLEDLVTGALGFQTSFAFAAVFLLVLVGHSLWIAFDQNQRFRTVVAYVLATVPAITTAAAVTAWGHETLALVPFSITFENLILGGMSSAFTIGPVAFLTFRRLATSDTSVTLTDTRDDYMIPNTWFSLLIGTIPLVWGVTGFLISVIFQPLQLEPTQNLVLHFGRTFAAFVDVSGPAGRHLQFVLGVIGLITILLVVFHDRRLVRK